MAGCDELVCEDAKGPVVHSLVVGLAFNQLKQKKIYYLGLVPFKVESCSGSLRSRYSITNLDGNQSRRSFGRLSCPAGYTRDW